MRICLPVVELALQPADAALSSTLPASLPTFRRRFVCLCFARSDCTSLPAAVAAGVAESTVGVADSAGCASEEALANSGHCAAESHDLVGAAPAVAAAAVECNRDATADVGRTGVVVTAVERYWCDERLSVANGRQSATGDDGVD